MLTKNSYIALDMFTPFISQVNTSLLKNLCSYFESIDVDFEILSMEQETKQVSYQSLQNEKFIDGHLKQEITLKFRNLEFSILKFLLVQIKFLRF